MPTWTWCRFRLNCWFVYSCILKENKSRPVMKNKRSDEVTSFLTNKIYFHTIKSTFYTAISKTERLNFQLTIRLTCFKAYKSGVIFDCKCSGFNYFVLTEHNNINIYVCQATCFNTNSQFEINTLEDTILNFWKKSFDWIFPNKISENI